MVQGSDLDPDVPKVPDVARCHRHATGAGDRRDLAVRRSHGAAGGTAGRGDLRVACGVTVERQDAALVLPQDRLDASLRRPAGRIATP